MTRDGANSELHGSEIAIIGMSGRFPRAKDLEEFWENLQAGVDSVTFLSDEELRKAGVAEDLLRNPNYVKARMVLEGADLFDAPFFGYTPKEVEIMDPQHRLFLESAFLALEDAGYAPTRYTGEIGVFAGAGSAFYLFNHVLANASVVEAMGPVQIAICNEPDSLASKVSYKLNLRGPCVAVQTFCSTSLVAVHLACQSLLNYECDLALAGGVSVDPSQDTGYLYQEGGIASPDGHCRTFDAKAKGSIYGSGVGVVVVKRLRDAVSDNDRIYAVIKGSAINNDGQLKAGYTAPGVEGQSAVVVEALANAGVHPEEISYIETHGTATALGDSVEIAALTKAFRRATNEKQFCALGSVKPNIGHLDRAAGVANLITAALAMHHRKLPPSLHFEQPNPDIDFAGSPFFVNTTLREWKTDRLPRRAGVSSFGLGGVNTHMVLEEWQHAKSKPSGRPFQLLALSAKSESALNHATVNLARRLNTQPETNLADVAYTLHLGRESFSHRRTLVCSSVQDAVASLQSLDPKRVRTAQLDGQHRQVFFMFPGVGDHYEGMAAEIYEREPVFREEVQRCASVLKSHVEMDICELISPRNGSEPRTHATRENELRGEMDFAALLNRRGAQRPPAKLFETRFAQTAVFVVNYALAKLLISWGIVPQAMIGYSLGEFVAATIAGVLSLEDALRLVSFRARLIDTLPHGAMLAVPMSARELEPLMDSHVSVAITNGPSMVVVSGQVDSVDQLQAVLQQRAVVTQRLNTTHAFHSKMMEPVSAELITFLEGIELREPLIPYISNVTGDWIRAEEARSPQYWALHMCRTVQFDQGIGTLLRSGRNMYLEVGPGQSLGSFIRQHPDHNSESEQPVIALMRNSFETQSDYEMLLGALGKLWLAGCEVDWSKFYSGEQRRRIPLPGYPFERESYWLKAGSGVAADPVANKSRQDAKTGNIADWFYQPVWKETPVWNPEDAEPLRTTQATWVLLMDSLGCGKAIAGLLERYGCKVIRIQPGDNWAALGEGLYSVRPAEVEDYLRTLKDLPRMPLRIVHLWNVEPTGSEREPLQRFASAQQTGFYSFLALVKALRQHSQSISIWTITANVQSLAGEEVCPEKSTILGACRVLPQEQPNITCSVIDIAWPPRYNWQVRWLAGQLAAEFAQGLPDARRGDMLVAYRDARRWRQEYEPVRLEAPQRPVLLPGGSYLITGGLGKVGLTIARHFALSAQARVILTTRSSFPGKGLWPEWLASHDSGDAVSAMIREFEEWEQLGARVSVVQADVADEQQMLSAAREFEGLSGVIHAAGVSDERIFRPLQELSRDQCEAHFRPKAHGLYVLEKILKGTPLDFCILFSSVSSVLGGLGFAAYTAANIFMDSFVVRHNSHDGQRWASVNWDTWQLREMTASSLGATIAEFAMTPQEGLQALNRVIAHRPMDRFVNSTGAIHARIKKWVHLLGAVENTTAVSKVRGRPQSIGPYVAPSTKLEILITETWQSFLGIGPIGVQDNFFELGGNSLMALQIMAAFSKISGLDLPISVMLANPTIGDLATAAEIALIERLEQEQV